MGLLSTLLLFPVMVPTKGLVFILEQIKERVDTEQLDEGMVEDELVSLSLLHEFGELSEADYLVQEAELLLRLNAIRVYKESLAVVTADSGGNRS